MRLLLVLLILALPAGLLTSCAGSRTVVAAGPAYYAPAPAVYYDPLYPRYYYHPHAYGPRYVQPVYIAPPVRQPYAIREQPSRPAPVIMRGPVQRSGSNYARPNGSVGGRSAGFSGGRSGGGRVGPR